MRLAVVLTLVIGALAACSGDTRGPPSEADRAALNKLRSDAAAAFTAGDADAVANIYATDAIIMLPGEPDVVGRAAIHDYYKSAFAQFTFKAALDSQEFTFVGPDWAFDRGKYTLTMTPKASGDVITEDNKYITLLHREPDGWKAKRDIYNSNKAGT